MHLLNVMTLGQARLNKFISARPIFQHVTKTGAQNQSQCGRLIVKQLKTFIAVLRFLNSFHFCFNSIKRFCNKAFAG